MSSAARPATAAPAVSVAPSRGRSPPAPATPSSDGTFSESASPDGTTISDPRLTMLSYSMFIARRFIAARSMCLDCHPPDVGPQSRYHPAGFLTRHPSSAYSREARCSDCHNPAQSCQSCHQQVGVVAARRIGAGGYHDAFRGFSLGHGQAARQSLESCASCHAERDCTACHSAVGGGFGFNPHGPGFNAARMLSKNPSVCIACHGRAIPIP